MVKKVVETSSGASLSVNHEPDSKFPTVVLFGWFMANPVHVEKYAAQWREMSFNTISTVGPPLNPWLLDFQRIEKFLLEILEVLAENCDLYLNGLVFQFFSNGGSIYAPWLAKSISDGNEVSQYLKAVVFDSGPGYLLYENGRNAIRAGLRLEKSHPMFFILSGAFWLWGKIGFLRSSTYREDFWRYFEEADYKVPELYIYSKNDEISDFSKLNELIHDRRENFGNDIREFVVDGADHVRILLKHPKEYREQLEQFSEEFLSISSRVQI